MSVPIGFANEAAWTVESR